MLKKIVIAMLLTLSAGPVLADEEKPAAPKDVIDAALEQCKQYAAEDGVQEADLNDYLLQCVNDELEEQGYQKLDKLEKE